jgi:hypothetical protein
MASYRSEHGPVKDARLHSTLQSQDRTQKGREGRGGGAGGLKLPPQIGTDFVNVIIINVFVMYAFVEISQ